MGDPQVDINIWVDELQPHARQDGAVNDGGVHRSLHHRVPAERTQGEAGRVVARDFQSAPMFNGSPLFSFGWFGGPLWYRNAQAASPYAVAMNARDIEAALSSLDEALEQGPSFTKFCLSLSANGLRGLINPFAKVYFEKQPESHWPNQGLLYHSDPYFNPAFDQVSPLRLKQ